MKKVKCEAWLQHWEHFEPKAFCLWPVVGDLFSIAVRFCNTFNLTLTESLFCISNILSLNDFIYKGEKILESVFYII